MNMDAGISRSKSHWCTESLALIVMTQAESVESQTQNSSLWLYLLLSPPLLDFAFWMYLSIDKKRFKEASPDSTWEILRH